MKPLLLLAIVLPVALVAAGCHTHHRHHGKCCPHKTVVTPLNDPVAATPRAVDEPPRVETTTTTTTTDESLELKTEDFSVRKETVSNGAARIRKYVVSEQKSVPVTVCREDFTVERIPGYGTPTTPWGGGELVIDIPLTREVAYPVVTPRVTEVIRVRKTVDCVTNLITGTVRTEKFEVLKP